MCYQSGIFIASFPGFYRLQYEKRESCRSAAFHTASDKSLGPGNEASIFIQEENCPLTMLHLVQLLKRTLCSWSGLVLWISLLVTPVHPHHSPQSRSDGHDQREASSSCLLEEEGLGMRLGEGVGWGEGLGMRLGEGLG